MVICDHFNYLYLIYFHNRFENNTNSVLPSSPPADFSLSPSSTASSTDKADRTAGAVLPQLDADNNNAAEEPARPPIDSVEERLMATAFYRLSVACHRDAMEARLALLNGAGQSFLNRQRQPAARKSASHNGSVGGGGTSNATR